MQHLIRSFWSASSLVMDMKCVGGIWLKVFSGKIGNTKSMSDDILILLADIHIVLIRYLTHLVMLVYRNF